MARMFGTDGVRGVAGSELTIELATKLGQAGAYVLTKEQEHQATIIVGCDTRNFRRNVSERINGRYLFGWRKCNICRSDADTCDRISHQKTQSRCRSSHLRITQSNGI